MLAQWHRVHLSFPDKAVLKGVTFSVHRGDKIGLVGENGAGKTCLFRLLLGELHPDRGEVFRASGLRIGYLHQTLLDTDPAQAGRPCFEVALEPFAHLLMLEEKINALSRKLSATTDQAELEVLLENWGEQQDRFERLGGYTFRTRVESTLVGLGLSAELWDYPVRALSAGQKVRLALARLLLGEYDLLLLDEPTNHLDVQARAWLEDTLREMSAAMIVVSHDRRFLDAVVDKIAYLDRGHLTEYAGSYSAFREQRDRQIAADWKKYEKQQRQVRKLKEQARNYENWSQAKEKQKRGVYDKGFIGHKAAKLMKRSLAAKKRLEQTIEDMKRDKPFEKDPVVIDFQAGETRRRVITVRNLSVGFTAGHPLASGITFDLAAGERLAIRGPNGAGKTTLLRTLLGELAPLEGVVQIARWARVGYFDQETRQLPSHLSALEAVLATGCDETLVRTVMGRMRIQQESVHKAVARLSSGERAKVLLTRLILGQHNLLILDEPTNHLDIETQDTLLEALDDFPGAIIFVSHDRHFNDALATRILEIFPTMAMEYGLSNRMAEPAPGTRRGN